MSDNDQGGSYVEVTERSWLGRLAGSFMAAIFGLILFFASFVLLYWNEGRAVEAITSLSAGARAAVTVTADKLDPANQGKLVYLTGTATVAGPPVDPLFKLAPANAIRLRRHVEMFQWREHEETRTERRTGGGETTVKTYSYNREWSDAAIESGKFKQPGGHGNPPMNVRNTDFAAQSTRIGAYQIDRALIEELGGFKPLAASGRPGDSSFRLDGEAFYRGAAADQPSIGDLRVSFQVLEAQPLTVVAAQVGQTLAVYTGPDGRTIALVSTGTRAMADMFQAAKSSEMTLTWILRGVGFLMMLFGVGLTASLLSWLASVLPILADVVNAAAALVALIVAVPLTLITIAIAWITHRPLIGGGLLLAAIVLGFGLRAMAPRRQPGFRPR